VPRHPWHRAACGTGPKKSDLFAEDPKKSDLFSEGP
jgi:hypothetical protein